MIKVLFDNQIFTKQSYGGISRYFAAIINGLNSKSEFDVFPKKYYSSNQHCFENNLAVPSIFFNGLSYKGKNRIENSLIKRQRGQIFKSLKKGNFGVFHPTYYDTDFLEYLPENKPFVLTVHDMIHELFLDNEHNVLSQETLGKRVLIPKANHIIAISEQTKKDILQFYPELESNKISVIYHGHYSLGISRSKPLYNKYLLFVGNRDLYKNFYWLVLSAADYIKETGIKLICAGGGNFNDIELELIHSLKLEGHIFYHPIDNDETLVNLYTNAICFIFPSKYEGFGLPILEAFSANCPVLLNEASCFPEIGGDAALYFNLDNPTSLIDQINSILTNNELKTNLIAKGRIRASLFNWNTSINKHIQVYQNCIERYN